MSYRSGHHPACRTIRPWRFRSTALPAGQAWCRRRASGWGLAARLRLGALVLLLAGCADTRYYWQSVSGHLQLMQASRPVSQWLADPQTPPALRQRLELAQRMRDVRRDRARPAGQRQLPPLCRPAAPGGGVERGGRTAAVADAQDLVFSGAGLRVVPGLFRRGRRRGARRPRCRPRAWR